MSAAIFVVIGFLNPAIGWIVAAFLVFAAWDIAYGLKATPAEGGRRAVTIAGLALFSATYRMLGLLAGLVLLAAWRWLS